jgi:hypothetical protein
MINKTAPNVSEVAGRLLRYWQDTGKGIASPRLAVDFAEAYLRPSSPNVDASWLYQLPPARPQDLKEIQQARREVR